MSSVNINKNTAAAHTLVAAPTDSGAGNPRRVRLHALSLHVKAANIVTLESSGGTVLATWDCAGETHIPLPYSVNQYLETLPGEGLVLRMTQPAVVSGFARVAIV